MTAVFERELKSYFTGFIGYVFGAFILFFAGLYMSVINFANGYASFEYVLNSMNFIYIIVVPVLTMRVISEERRQKTDLLLYSLPRSMAGIVLGKYFAMVAVLAAPAAVICTYPLLLSCFGSINLAMAYGNIFAFFMLGAVLIAMGMFISSLSENQVVAAVICLLFVLLNFFLSDIASFFPTTAVSSLLMLLILALVVSIVIRFLTKSFTAAAVFMAVAGGGLIIWYIAAKTAFEGLFSTIISQLSVFDRYYIFVDGMFDGTAIIYFITVIALFIFYTVQSLEKRRWS